MGQGGRTGEHLEMVAAKAGNYTPVVQQIDVWVARIECLSSVYFQQYYLILPISPLGIVVSQTGHPVALYWFSSVEILSSKLYGNQRQW
jgi:hypothetical protein